MIEVKSVFNKFKEKAKRLTLRSVGYFDGELHRFNYNDEGQIIIEKTTVGEFSPVVLILARSQYQEKLLSYPIDSKKEIAKLMAMEFAGEQSFYTIANAENGNSQVNCWICKDLPKATFYVPESYLIGSQLVDNEIASIEQLTPIYVTQKSGVVHSAISSPVISNSRNFALSAGVSDNHDVLTVSNQQKPAFLIDGIRNIQKDHILRFFVKPEKEDSMSLLHKILIPSFLTLTIYLALSSAVLELRHGLLESEVASYSGDVNSALSMQNDVDLLLENYVSASEFVKSQNNWSPFWVVLSDFYKEVEFTNVRVVDGRVVIRGKCDSALNVLERLSNHNMVSDAKFDFPTRKLRKRDAFAISFVFKESKGNQVPDANQIKETQIDEATNGAT